MTSTYTSNQGIEKPATGDQSGTWGGTVNTNMDIIDRAISGVGALTLTGSTTTLTTTDGTLTDGMYRVLVLGDGGDLGSDNTLTISPNDQDKAYLVYNNLTANRNAIFSQGTGANATVANGATAWIYADGAGSGAAVRIAMLSTEISDQDGDTKIQVEEGGDDDDTIRFDTGGSERMRLNSSGTLEILTDGAAINFGADQDVTITHDADDGLFLKSAATGDDNPFLLTIQTGETDIGDNDVLGKIAFQAPDEAAGTDAILVAAGIQAVAEGDFSSSSNATSLELMTGSSGAATTKVYIDSTGNVGIGESSPSSYYGDTKLVLSHTTSGENAAITLRSATDGYGTLAFADTNSGNGRFAGYVQYNHNTDILLLGIAESAEVRLSATALYPSTADGTALGSATHEWSDLFLADSSVINFGADQDVTLTHNPDVGLTLNGVMAATTFEPTGDTAAGDNAAIGYTASEGIIVCGQGSSYDVTVKNDADSTVCYVPTGGINMNFAGHILVNTTSDAGYIVCKASTDSNLIVLEDNASGAQYGTMSIRMDNSAGTGMGIKINRQSSDGNLIVFAHAGSTEGTISVSGATVTYGTFTGAHDGQWGTGESPDVEPSVGTLISTVDEPFERVIVESEEVVEEDGKDPVTRMKRRRLGPSDSIESGETVVDLPKAQLTKVKITDTQADNRVYGVFGNTNVETGDSNIHALGTSMVRVIGAVAGGDLIQSSATPGVAEKQSDDVIRSSTVGKVSRAVAGVGERLVPCTMYCG